MTWRAVGWRLAALGVFVLALVPFVVIVVPTVVVAAVAALLGGEEAADRVLLNPVLGWFADMAPRLLARGKAAQERARGASSEVG